MLNIAERALENDNFTVFEAYHDLYF